MRLQVGKIYRSKNGDEFLIIAKIKKYDSRGSVRNTFHSSPMVSDEGHFNASASGWLENGVSLNLRYASLESEKEG